MISDSAMTAQSPIGDLLEELSGKNFVRVSKFVAVKKPFAPTFHKRVMDEISHEGVANLPALVLHDNLRMLAGKKPIYLGEAMRRFGGELISVTPNLRTNTGIDYCANALGSTSQPSQADYIGLSNNTITPAATDDVSIHPWDTASSTDAAASSSRGEYTGVGLTRKQATYAHTTGVASYTMAATWTASGTITAVRVAGLFGGSAKTSQSSSTTTNILFLENTFTATTLANTDQLSLTWTVNI